MDDNWNVNILKYNFGYYNLFFFLSGLFSIDLIIEPQFNLYLKEEIIKKQN